MAVVIITAFFAGALVFYLGMRSQKAIFNKDTDLPKDKESVPKLSKEQLEAARAEREKRAEGLRNICAHLNRHGGDK